MQTASLAVQYALFWLKFPVWSQISCGARFSDLWSPNPRSPFIIQLDEVIANVIMSSIPIFDLTKQFCESFQC